MPPHNKNMAKKKARSKGLSTTKKTKVYSSKSNVPGRQKAKMQHIKLAHNTISEKKTELSESETKQQLKTIKSTVSGLRRQLESIKSEKESTNQSNVPDPEGFNKAVRNALALPAILTNMCGVKNNQITNERRFNKFQPILKTFLKDLVILSKSLTDTNAIQAVVSCGFLPLVPMYSSMETIAKALIKQVTVFWSTGEEKLRVVSFLTLYRLLSRCSEELYALGTKSLFEAYLSNSRFTSTKTIAMINFMRTSLQEVYLLNEPIAYRHAFINIRQLSILLRSALLNKTQEERRVVFHWQYIHSLKLWGQLISKSHPSPILQPLLYPVVQLCTGILGLQKSPLTFPTNFHIFKILSSLNRSTGKFIPVLPHILEMLRCKQLSSQSKSQNPLEVIEWDCILKLSSSELSKCGFGDQLLKMVDYQVMDYLHIHSASISFPELIYPAIYQLKKIAASCKNTDRVKVMKKMLSKFQENATFIEDRRKAVTFKVTDFDEIKAWTVETRKSRPPIDAVFKRLESRKPIKFLSNLENDAFKLPMKKTKSAPKTQPKINDASSGPGSEQDYESDALSDAINEQDNECLTDDETMKGIDGEQIVDDYEHTTEEGELELDESADYEDIEFDENDDDDDIEFDEIDDEDIESD